MMKIRINKIICNLFCLCFSFFIFSNDLNYTVVSSEERLTYLVSFIESNLEGTDVLINFKEEQRLWELYKEYHLKTLFPNTIDGVKMLWGSALSKQVGDEVLILNMERIRTLESYLIREFGTDGEGRFKEYVEELRRMQNQKF